MEAKGPEVASAPDAFVKWMTEHRHVDRRTGLVYHYHPRSDAHSVALCRLVAADLVQATPALRHAMADGRIACGINVPFAGRDGRLKTLDLAFGKDSSALPAGIDLDHLATARSLSCLILSCEAKSVMTEHSKSQPRLYDELSSSHQIIHEAGPQALAAGIVVVNIAAEFISPTRQSAGRPVHVTKHKQPHSAARMISHLRGLPIRSGPEGVGFDAFSIIVIECDNVGPAALWTAPPAPQPGDPDHYLTLVARLSDSIEAQLRGSDH